MRNDLRNKNIVADYIYGMSFAEIGRAYNLSRQQVKNICNKARAKRKLRNSMAFLGLDYVAIRLK